MDKEWKITACPHDCPCGCTMRARFAGGKIDMEPERSNPYTKFICSKGLRWRKKAISPNRLKTPVLRTETGWKELSWESAWSIWARKIEESISKYGPTSLMLLTCAGSLYFSKSLMKLVFNELGGYTGTKGSLCSCIGYEGLNSCTGKNKGFTELSPFVPIEHFKRAKAVLFWGKNAYETNPQLIPILIDMRKKGAKTASIEIRKSSMVEHCDEYWQISPGTDWALAAWLCRAMIERGLDAGNWRQRVVNSAEFEKYILTLESDELIAISGLDRSQAEDLLKWLISNKPVCHYPSYGAQRYLHGDLQFMWIFALTVLSGAFDDASAAFSSGKDEHSLFPENLKLDNDLEIRKLPVGCWGNYIEKINTKLISNAGDAALNTTYYGPPIEVLMIANANPVRQAPNTLNIKSAMSKIPFKVCSDLFMTDTAEMCDLVLPVSSFLEDEDWIGSYWHSYLVRSERVIPRYADSKTDVEIYAGLSAALGQKLDLIEAKRRMDMSILADERLSMVSDRVYLWNEPSYWLSAESKAELPLTIPDHNANNIYTKLQSNVLNATWHRFITVHCGTYINGQSDEPRIGKDDKEIPEIFLNPNIIKELNLSLGQRIKVVSSNGNEIYMRVSEDASVSLKYAYAYQGNKTINLLTNAYEAPGSGAPYAECFVRIIV